MAIIEELPDSAPPKGLENLDLNAMIEQAAARNLPQPTTEAPSDGPAPGAEMPAPMAEVRSQSMHEFVRQLNKMPLFMTELDETGADDEGENEALEAIRALQYEGSPVEIARNFREQGNECFRAKKYKDARVFYTKAINVDCDDKEMNIALLNNRAQCNLEMGNYGKAITDCKASLALNPGSEKPWFRAAKGLLAVDKLDEADACVENALVINPTHREINALRAKISQRREYLQRKEEERKAREEKQKAEESAIKIALKARNITNKKTERGTATFGADLKIAFSAPNDPRTPLTFPVALVYYTPGVDLTRPITAQSDLIQAFSETSTIGEQLEEVLSTPLPWDRTGEYMPATVDAYLETKTGGLLKFGKRVSLLEALSGGKVDVIDGLVCVYVVAKSLNAEFIKAWKKQRMGQDV